MLHDMLALQTLALPTPRREVIAIVFVVVRALFTITFIMGGAKLATINLEIPDELGQSINCNPHL